MSGTDPLAETLVEVIADTAKFRPAVLKEMSETATAAGEVLDRSLSTAMQAVAEESANAFGDTFKTTATKDSAEAGVSSAEAFKTGFTDVGGDTGSKLSRDVNGRLRDERGRFVQVGVESGTAFSQGLKKSAGDGAAEAASNAAAKFGSFLKTGFFTLASGATAATGAITAFGVKSAGDLQQTNVAFTQLTGSAKNAQVLIQNLQQFAANTPFEFKDVAKASAQLLAVGDAAGITQQNLIPTLTTIGDVGSAFGVSGAQINGAVLALSQMAGAGKIDMGNLNQLSDNLGGFPARAVVAQQAAALWGVTTAEAMKRIGNGGLDAQTGIQLLLQGMKDYPGAAGGMEKQSQTLNGVLSTFADTARNSLSNAFTPAIPQITDALNKLVPVMQSSLDKLGPVISGTLVAILPLAGQFVSTFATVMQPIVPILAYLGPAISTTLGVLGPIFAQIVTAIAPLAGPLNNIIVMLVQLFQQAITPLIPAINLLVTAFVQGIIPLLDPIQQLASALIAAFGPVLAKIVEVIAQTFAAFAPVITEIAQIFITALLPVLPQLADAFIKILTAIQPLIPLLAGALMQVLQAIAPVLPQIVDAFLQLTLALVPLVPLFVKILEVIIPIAAKLDEWLIAKILIPVIEGLAGAVRFLAGFLADLVGFLGTTLRFARDLGDYIGTLFVKAWQDLNKAVDAVVSWFRNLPTYFSEGLKGLESLLSSTWDSIMKGVDAVADFFAALPGRIINELIALPGQLLDLFVNGLALLLQGIGEALGLIIVAFVEFGRGIVFAVTELPGILVSLFTTAMTAVYDAVVAGGKQVIGWFTYAAVAVVHELAALPGQLADLFTTAVTAGYNAAVTAGVAVLGWFAALPGRIGSGLSSLASTIGGVFSSALDGTKKIVSDGIDTLVGWFKGIPGKLGDLATGMVDAGKKLITNIFDGFAQVPSIGANLAKSVVNAIIKAINWAIDQVNDGLSNINILGVGFGDHTIPDIPEWHAMGGIFDRPTRIGVGEAGREVLLPLTNPARTAQLAQESGLMNVLAAGGLGGTHQTYNLTVNTAAQNPETVAAITVGRLARMGA